MAQPRMDTHAPLPRLPKNHRLVYDVLLAQGEGIHLATADVYALVRKRRPAIGHTTVYRALARLRELGLLAEIAVPGTSVSYFEAARSPHAHFRCDDCGAISDIEYTPTRATLRDLEHKACASVREVCVSLHGVCDGCRSASSQRR